MEHINRQDVLKFRVWDKINKEYVKVPMMLKADGSLAVSNPKHFEVERCTGLHDSCGELIYENDIVQSTDDETYTVEWDDQATEFILVADTFSVSFDNYYGYELEVVSDIHQKQITDTNEEYQ